MSERARIASGATLATLAAVLSRLALVALTVALAARPVAAHGGRTGQHAHTVPVAVFLGAVVLLAVSLAADHWDLVDRSVADVGVVAGGLGIVLSVGLLWL